MGVGGVLPAIPFPILERIPIVGDVAISPHGIGIALGFLLGAMLAMPRWRRRGLGHRYVADIPETMQDLLVWAALGAVVGARLFYVLTHLGDGYLQDPLSILAVYEGGLSFLGGLAGAILVVLPAVVRRRYRARQMLDAAAPGVALGLVVGRTGDLIIGEHLGPPTDFVLGWRCTGSWWTEATNSLGYSPPRPYPVGADPTQGCFQTAVHQTALYDWLTAGVVLAVLLWLERRPRWDGFFVAVFVYLYGGIRFVSEFVRPDKFVLGLTGSQWALLAGMAAMTVYLWWRRPWDERRWAWDLEFDHPWLTPPAEGQRTGG